MLANLDNEVHFKNVFADPEIFKAFAKDVIGIDIDIDQVETEKVLPNKVSAIKFRMDLFAEDAANRTVVEIQKVDYDYSYDRFAHYFLANVIDMQRSSRDYSYAKDVYVIVVVTAAYRISELNGKPIKDDVLVTRINPRSLDDVERVMTKHQMIILNTTYVDDKTPADIKDWMDLIIESMQNPENPKINYSKPSIAKAARLAMLDRLTPEQLAEAKEMEMRKATVALVENTSRTEEKRKRIEKMLRRGKLTLSEIAEDFEVTLDYVKAIADDLTKDD